MNKKQNIKLNLYKVPTNNIDNSKQQKIDNLTNLLNNKDQMLTNIKRQLSFLKQENYILKIRLTRISQENLSNDQSLNIIKQLKNQLQNLKSKNAQILYLYKEEKGICERLKQQLKFKEIRLSHNENDFVFKEVSLNQKKTNKNSFIQKQFNRNQQEKNNKQNQNRSDTQYTSDIKPSIHKFQSILKRQNNNDSQLQTFNFFLKNIFQKLKTKSFPIKQINLLPKIQKFMKISQPNKKDIEKILETYPFELSEQQIKKFHKRIVQQLEKKYMDFSGQNILDVMVCKLQQLDLAQIMNSDYSDGSRLSPKISKFSGSQFNKMHKDYKYSQKGKSNMITGSLYSLNDEKQDVQSLKNSSSISQQGNQTSSHKY